MPRPSMMTLIARTRLLIADAAGPTQTFDDDEIQDALDQRQLVVNYAPLRPEATFLPSGVVEYRDYFAGVGDWEADETLYDASLTLLTPATRDRLTGHWTFLSPGQPPPIFIVGRVYDVSAAAADLLETWAAKTKLEFDFATDNQQFQRNQKIRSLLDLAQRYRRRQRIATVVQARTDIF